ncbi:RagB/SusD family nutrient uptake outer membrane protein [Butyricimonas sp.]|uniref:RagB/SusD family nutrient uptake outer membrane protein n=1 Tax=Butyricimonas sp. TaxID=1969738 RepID=UPI0025BF9282|nr:RagB/SusD family nutrient uptake outer membrane protein [Butyricimonas sp.]
MKKIFIILFFLPLFACDDWLDIESEKSVTYLNFFKSEQDLESTLISMFGFEKNICASSMVHPFGWCGLQCDSLADNEGYRELDPQSFMSKMYMLSWSQNYKAIYLANMLEENRFRFENISEERADYWIAQANFIKAFAYFNVAQNWGDAPLAQPTESTEAVGKSPVDSLFAQALRAAEKALILPTYDKLTDAHGDAVTSKQYASLGTVHTLLANIYAWMGGLYDKEEYWKKAEEHASLVIDGKVGGYKLELTVADMVKNTLGPVRKSNETIFSIAVNNEDENRTAQVSFYPIYPGQALINYPYSPTNYTDIEDPGQKKMLVATVEKIFPEEADTRRKEYWKDLGQQVTQWEYIYDEETWEVVDSVPYAYSEYAFINKWSEPYYSTDQSVIEHNKGIAPLLAMEGDRVVWRLADLILLRAECRARLNMAKPAKDDLDAIRVRAGLEGYEGSGTADIEELRKEIFHERERELFGEGQRYYDIVRNGYFRTELSSVYKSLTDADVKGGALYLPVARNSFEKNTLMKQNSYWLWHQQ